MKIFYLKSTVFTDDYRCQLVLRRILKFVSQDPPQAILVSGLKDHQIFAFDQFLSKLLSEKVQFIYQNGTYMIDQTPITLTPSHCWVDQQVFAPLEGSLAMIEKKDQVKLSYVVFDIFADETFADYHGELDDHQMQELTKLLKQTTSK